MPRVTQFESQVISKPGSQAVVAAAKQFSSKRGENKKPREDTGWQDRAWLWYDVIGEFRYACAWVGNVLSRAILQVEKNGKEVSSGEAHDALMALFGGPEGQKEMFRQLGIQFTVAGEAYIVGEDGGEKVGDKWWVAAASEITLSAGDVWKIGKKEIDNPLVIRLWRPHPRKGNAPDSPARAVLPILSEIDGLTKHVAAQIDSRLAGAGILLLPDNISFATTSTKEGGTESVSSAIDPFLEELMDTMMAAIRDREDAAALVPILLQANGEYLDKVRHLTFSTPLDEQAIELRKEAIRRLALGMDMPPEVLTGTSDMNHWNAWQMEDASIKAHTEPLLQVIVSSLTTGYLWPYLESTGMDEEKVRQYTFQVNTAKMRLRPDRSKESLELYDRGLLSEEAAIRENGFEAGDMMDDKERQGFFTRKVASGSTTPELVAEALRILGLPFQVTGESVEVQEARPIPSLLEHPEKNPPDPAIISDEAAAVAEVVVFRALERAGNRIRSKYRDRISMGAENVPAHTLYRFTRQLDEDEIADVTMDAWSCLASLPRIPVSTETLDEYTKSLIRSNQPHDSRRFRAFIESEANV